MCGSVAELVICATDLGSPGLSRRSAKSAQLVTSEDAVDWSEVSGLLSSESCPCSVARRVCSAAPQKGGTNERGEKTLGRFGDGCSHVFICGSSCAGGRSSADLSGHRSRRPDVWG